MLTENPGELPQDSLKRKDRLFLHAFEDPLKASVVITLPTVGRASLSVLLATMAVRGWVPRTVEVRTASRPGLPLDQAAPVYVHRRHGSPPESCGVCASAHTGSPTPPGAGMRRCSSP